jgi:Ricin-type beta-trefoil lectin domain
MAMRVRRLAGLLAAGALAAGMSAGTGVTAQAATARPAAAAAVSPSPGSTGAWYEVYAPLIDHSGYYRCLDVPEASVQPDQAVQTYHCHGYASNGANQRWRFWPNADGSYQIQNVNSQLCLQVAVYGSQPVWQYYCDGYQNEDWKIISANGYQFVLESVAVNGACAAVSSFSGDSSTIVKQPCDLGNAQELWQLG